VTGPLQFRVENDSSHAADASDSDAAQVEDFQSVTDHNLHDPGPSFVEDERPTDRLTELPAWLQTFAAQESARAANVDEDEPPLVDNETSTQPIEESAPVIATADSSLPDWLRSDPDHHDEKIFMPISSNSDDAFDSPELSDTNSFLSDEDLPAWLRAFSQDAADSSPVPSRGPSEATAGFAPATSMTAVRVPPVENVWLSAYERQSLGPGATLFALLASNPGSEPAMQQEAYYPDAIAREPRSDAQRNSAGSEAVPAGAIAERESPHEAVEPQRNSGRILMLTLLLVMVVILISIWQFS
jgi:hypothetical protein